MNARMLQLIQKAAASAKRSPVVLHRSLSTVASSRSADAGGFSKEDVLHLLNQRQSERNDMAYSLSFGDNANAAFSSSMVEPSALMREQLQFSQDQLRRRPSPPPTMAAAAASSPSSRSFSSSEKTANESNKMDNKALPKSLKDVIRQKSRAIVVTETEKPFRVVDVNECWEGLCGFSFTEARGKTLGKLLKGPATNQVAATGLVAHLLEGEEAGAVLTNYTKEGRAFRNRIRVGPLYDATGKNITHFVGVLEELNEEQIMM